MKSSYLSVVERSFPFLPRTKNNLNRALDHTVSLYARIATEGKLTVASSDLKTHLRERVVWERNTIWRDMVEQERRQQVP
jgi:phosphate transporter